MWVPWILRAQCFSHISPMQALWGGIHVHQKVRRSPSGLMRLLHVDVKLYGSDTLACACCIQVHGVAFMIKARACTHTHNIYIYIYMYIYVCLHTYTYIQIHVYLYTSICICVYMSLYVLCMCSLYKFTCAGIQKRRRRHDEIDAWTLSHFKKHPSGTGL